MDRWLHAYSFLTFANPNRPAVGGPWRRTRLARTSYHRDKQTIGKGVDFQVRQRLHLDPPLSMVEYGPLPPTSLFPRRGRGVRRSARGGAVR